MDLYIGFMVSSQASYLLFLLQFVYSRVVTEGAPRCSMKEFLEIYFFTTPAVVLCQKRRHQNVVGVVVVVSKEEVEP